VTERVFGFDLLAQQAAEHVAAEVSQMAAHFTYGDTPIERLLALALMIYDQYRYSAGTAAAGVVFMPDDNGLVERFPRAMRVERQVDVGGWRVDFLIHVPNGLDGPDKLFIVECDGHEFHERTKDQAARDRSRDRAATVNGIPILRFTGSELWRDPFGCARQVFDLSGRL